MNFLSPAAIAIASLLTIPPLVALYFLKLKRTVYVVPSTFLWRRAVEDLQVNSPFQRLRSSLLLLLQLLVLIAAAIALGQPMWRTARHSEKTIIILVDQSASMSVVEADGKSRLEMAKEQAKRTVDNMPDDARAMVIAFCDRAQVISSFDSDKDALRRKIDSIAATDSRSALVEAIGLAEAYAQNLMIGTDEAGGEIAPESPAPPASVFLFTDGRIADTDAVALQRLKVDAIHMTTIGSRSDNVGITAMSARRTYERPELLEVVATVRNFGREPVVFDAVLYVDGVSADVQSVRLDALTASTQDGKRGSIAVLAFDSIEFPGAGAIEVALRVDDALLADNRAWTVVEPSRRVRVLLVSSGSLFLRDVLSTLSVELVMISPDAYERVEDDVLIEGQRSLFDVVVFDRVSTARLPRGNYFFWGAAPQIEGVSSGRVISEEVIFDWDDAHPILRHVPIDALEVFQWLELTLPPEAESLIDGQTSPVLAYLTRGGSQFLISAFSPIVEDDDGELRINTPWVMSTDFVVFMQNAIQYLSSSVAISGRKSLTPGQPKTLLVSDGVDSIRITRPDGEVDEASASGLRSIHYARTRQVGVYRTDSDVPGQDLFAVNLFDAVESHIEPSTKLTISAAEVEARAGEIEVNVPAWPYLLLAILVLLTLEWIVYNRRVFV